MVKISYLGEFIGVVKKEFRIFT